MKRPRLVSVHPVIVMLLTVLAASCSSPATPEQVHETATLSSTPAPLPTTTHGPAVVPTQVDLVIEPAQACIPIEESLPGDLALSGVWVRNSGTPYLENIETGADVLLPKEGTGVFSTRYGDMAISPDGKKIAYIDTYFASNGYQPTQRRLQVMESSGHSLNMDYWKIDWQQIIGWVDHENLALLTGEKKVLILNPFTGNWHERAVPDRLQQDYGWVLINPKLDLILNNPYYSGSLQELQTGKVLLQGGQFSWSADGSVIVNVSDNLVTVISETREKSTLNISKAVNFVINEAQVSPDGSQLFLTSRTYAAGTNRYRAYILDIPHRQMNEICLGEFSAGWMETAWSRDNRYVVSGIWASYDDQFDLLIDTQELRAYKLISGQFQHRIAWLASP